MKQITKIRRIRYSTKGNQIKGGNTGFGKFNSENDVIQDAKKKFEI